MPNDILEANTNELEIIEFYIDEILPDGSHYSGKYGMNVAKVLEIIRNPSITIIPNQHHAAALGTFNLRGKVMPLVDLSIWLDKKMVQSENNKVIVSEFSGIVTAFLVSGVNRIHRLNWDQVEAPNKYLHQYSHESITGVIRLEGKIIFILDMEKVISAMNPKLDMHNITDLSANALEQDLTDGKHFNVLIVDDSTSIRHIISSTFKKAGFTVSSAQNGKEAWKMMEAWQRQARDENKKIEDYVQAVVSDIEMPEMDGHALTRKIKRDDNLKHIPVVLFSSIITSAMRYKGENAGADEQYAKPDLPSLTFNLRKIIANKLGI